MSSSRGYVRRRGLGSEGVYICGDIWRRGRRGLKQGRADKSVTGDSERSSSDEEYTWSYPRLCQRGELHLIQYSITLIWLYTVYFIAILCGFYSVLKVSENQVVLEIPPGFPLPDLIFNGKGQKRQRTYLRRFSPISSSKDRRNISHDSHNWTKYHRHQVTKDT